MVSVLHSIPETNRRWPCEVNKDVLNLLFTSGEIEAEVTLPKARPRRWKIKLGLKTFLPLTFLLKYNMLENVQDEFQKVTMF